MALYDKTTAELAGDKLKSDLWKHYWNLVNAQHVALEQMWKTPDVTPQEMCDQFGTQCGKLVDLIAETRKAILILNPNAASHPSNSFKASIAASYGTFTVNPDGTVTIDSIV